MNEMTGELVTLFFANVIFIALKAFQQLNVTGMKWKLVPPTSFLMGQAEVWIMGTVAAVFITSDTTATKLLAGLTLGVAGAIGSTMSMILHRRLERGARQRMEALSQGEGEEGTGSSPVQDSQPEAASGAVAGATTGGAR